MAIKKEYDPNDVSQPVPDYEEYMKLLELPHTLLGGTPAMRAKGTQYLPKEKKENDMDYKNRLNRSFLNNEFDLTVDKLSGEVFSEPVMLSENMSEEIRVWTENIDLSGVNLDRFSVNLFESALVDGVVHILIDLPQIETRTTENGQVVFLQKSEDGEETWRPLTIQAMNENGWRPYFVQIKAEQVIGWRHENQNGNQVLVQVRIRETIEKSDGRYGVKLVERIRVLEPGIYEIYELAEEKDKEPEWVRVESGVTGFDYIPLRTKIFGDPLSPMTAKPPLDDLAYLNLAHWQSSSDQRNILHYARLIVYFAKMLDLETDKEEDATIGANVLIYSNQPEADMKVVEPSGKAIEAGRNDLKDLELAMGRYGLGLITGQKPGGVTATEKAIDTAENDSSLKSWAIDLQELLNLSLRTSAQMMQMDESAIGDGVKVNTDFKSFLRSMEIRELREAFNDGLLPREIVIEELKRRGVIRDDIDFQELMLMINNEENNLRQIGE